MKVFISWSGERSKKIAEALKQWLRYVIQSVDPFVSSQDISKGARWSTDIAQQLQDTSFGILCVTKENFQQPWLIFEAGALSKTIDKTYVVPLLFDLEPSDLQDSPLLQFQAASFSREEIKKLIESLNKACVTGTLSQQDLDATFDVWFPKLQESLAAIPADYPTEGVKVRSKESEKTLQILEEVLELSRINQKLLRNPDRLSSDILISLQVKIEELISAFQSLDISRIRNIKYARQLDLSYYSDIGNMSANEINPRYRLVMLLLAYRDIIPWIYDLGLLLLGDISRVKSNTTRHRLINQFRHIFGTVTMNDEFSNSPAIRTRIPDPFLVMRILDELESEPE